MVSSALLCVSVFPTGCIPEGLSAHNTPGTKNKCQHSFSFPPSCKNLPHLENLAAAGCCFCLFIWGRGFSFNFAAPLFKSWSEKRVAVGGRGEGKRREKTLWTGMGSDACACPATLLQDRYVWKCNCREKLTIHLSQANIWQEAPGAQKLWLGCGWYKEGEWCSIHVEAASDHTQGRHS